MEFFYQMYIFFLTFLFVLLICFSQLMDPFKWNRTNCIPENHLKISCIFLFSFRILHHPLLYKHIHKIHHEWTAPVGLVALYAHPIEHLVSNMLPPIIGPILMGSHLATAWLWFALVLLSTTVAHSGYHFPFLPSPEAHDFHHLK